MVRTQSLLRCCRLGRYGIFCGGVGVPKLKKREGTINGLRRSSGYMTQISPYVQGPHGTGHGRTRGSTEPGVSTQHVYKRAWTNRHLRAAAKSFRLALTRNALWLTWTRRDWGRGRVLWPSGLLPGDRKSAGWLRFPNMMTLDTGTPAHCRTGARLIGGTVKSKARGQGQKENHTS